MGRKRKPIRVSIYLSDTDFEKFKAQQEEHGVEGQSKYLRYVTMELYPDAKRTMEKQAKECNELFDGYNKLSEEYNQLTTSYEKIIDQNMDLKSQINDLKDRNECLVVACRAIQQMPVWKLVWHRLTSWNNYELKKNP